MYYPNDQLVYKPKNDIEKKYEHIHKLTKHFHVAIKTSVQALKF